MRLSEYQKQDWQVEDGLPQSNVRAISQMPGGLLLLGTTSGVATFDGLRFRSYGIDFSENLANESVNALLSARNGELWVGTDGGGVLHVKDKTLIRVSESAGFSHERVRAMIEDGYGVIWVATQNGVERIVPGPQGDRIEKLLGFGEISGNITSPFAEDGNGGMLVITSSGLFRWADGAAHKLTLSHPKLGSPMAVSRDRKGIFWVGTRSGLLRVTVHGYAVKDEVVSGVAGTITAMFADEHNSLWVGTRAQGLFRVLNGKVERWTGGHGLADNNVRSLFEDDEHNIWIGFFSRGLSRWREGMLAPYGKEEGFPDTFAATVLGDHRGDLWLGTWGKGLYRLRAGKLEMMPLPGDSQAIRALAEDRHGNVWIGTWFNGVFRYDGKQVEHFLLGTESITNATSAILVDEHGGLWIGTYMGLLYFSRGIPEPHKGMLMLEGQLVTCIEQDSDGTILAGTSTGLFRIGGGKLEPVLGLANSSVISISKDEAHNVWVGTKAGGLDYVSGNHAQHLYAVSGLRRDPVFSVIEDTQGFLWMGTTRGILRVARTELEELAHGKRTVLNTWLLAKDEGMRSSECGGASQPPAARMKDGSIWFTTAKGFVHTVSGNTNIHLPVPTISLRGVSLETGMLDPSERIRLTPGSHEISFIYDAKRLANPAQLEFRYKLDNYDTDWTYTRARSAQYRHLPPGNYQFHVQVRNAGADWAASELTLPVYQKPFVYQTWWFYLLLTIAVAAGIIRLFQWRVARAKGELGIVLEERNRIAREWHDSMMAGFAAIAWQLESTARLLGNSESAAAKACQLARNMVGHCQAEARRIIWDLREGEEATGPLSKALSNALTNIRFKECVETELSVDGEEVSLSPGHVHHLVCIGQEAVTNAIRHGQAKEIKIHLDYSADSLSISVKDDGRGFHAAGKTVSALGHFGIPVMEERARKLGGSLRVESGIGQGTEILVNIPFHQERA